MITRYWNKLQNLLETDWRLKIQKAANMEGAIKLQTAKIARYNRHNVCPPVISTNNATLFGYASYCVAAASHDWDLFVQIWLCRRYENRSGCKVAFSTRIHRYFWGQDHHMQCESSSASDYKRPDYKRPLSCVINLTWCSHQNEANQSLCWNLADTRH